MQLKDNVQLSFVENYFKRFPFKTCQHLNSQLILIATTEANAFAFQEKVTKRQERVGVTYKEIKRLAQTGQAEVSKSKIPQLNNINKGYPFHTLY